MSYLFTRPLFRACSTIAARKVSKIPPPVGKEKWDLFAGVLVERLPVITKTLTPLETDFKTMLGQLEFENSLKSNHEIRKETEKRQAELLKAGKLDLDSEALKQTAQDLEDAYNDEFNKFKPSPRITEADKNNDTKALNRKLEETLTLLTEHKLGGKSLYILPQGIHIAGESMRQTAERVLKEAVGDDLPVSFYGNAPVGFHKYKYPTTERKESVGAKIFFFRCILKHQNVNIAERKVKWQWLDHSELQKTLSEPYYQSVSQFLL